MRPLAALERMIERLVERSSARIFRTQIQPLQVQRRVERAMETHRRSVAGRTMVPNRFTVRLNPDDLAALEPIANTLVSDLADAALTFARAHRYVLVDRPRVALVPNRAIAAGDVQVDAQFEEAGAAASAGADGPPGAGGGNGHAAVSDRTMVFSIPQPDAPVAILRELRPDGSERAVYLDGRPLTIGRGADNGLVLQDSRVSRHHARLQARRGTLVLSDLGSTNGSRVNGVTVQEVVLGPGDRIQLGDTVLVVDTVSQA
jgi:hypothetical protein